MGHALPRTWGEEAMSMTTTLHWTRYDGTDETLPQFEQRILLVQAGETRARQVCSWLYRSRINGTLSWEGAFVLENVREGDLWAPWPEVPKVEIHE